MKLRLISLVAAAGVLLMPATSSAADFCVGAPQGCTGTNEGSDLQGALDDAKANPGADRVLVGPGTYSEPDGFIYVDNDGSNSVDIRGVGVTQPSLTMTTSTMGESVLNLAQPGSTVTDVGIQIPTLATSLFPIGIYLQNATARDVVVTGSDPTTQQIGIEFQGEAQVQGGSISLDPDSSVGIYAISGSDTSVTDTSVRAARAVDVVASGASTASFSRDRFSSRYEGLYVYYGSVDVDNTLFDLRGGNGQTGAGATHAIHAFTVNGSPQTDVDARELTIRNGDSGSSGIYEETFVDNSTISVDLRDSIIEGVGHPIHQGAVTTGSAYDVSTSFSDYDPAGNLPVTPTAGQTRTETSNVNVPPGFVAPQNGANGVAGDYRLRFDSPLIDAGSSTPLAGGELDLGGLARIVDGATPLAGGIRDIGAHEYQRLAPLAKAAATPSSLRVKKAVQFSAAGSVDPDADPVTYSWKFDDGASATGPTVTHAFATPGKHIGTVTVTDSTGRTGAATASVSISCKVKRKAKKRAAGGAKRKTCKRPKKKR